MLVNTRDYCSSFLSYLQNLKIPEGGEPKFCFADLPLLEGNSPRHYPTKNGVYYSYYDQRHINIAGEAEYMCVGTLTYSRDGRRQSNISYILICYVDLDKKSTLTAILKRLKQIRLIRFATIIETSPGKFQLKFYLRVPVPTTGKPFKCWQAVQKALGRAFKPFGVDMKPLLDIARLLRNEFAVNPINTKYDPPHKVIVHQFGELTDLDTLVEALTSAGCFYRGWQSIPRSKEKFILFFKKHPLWRGTIKRLSELTGIAERTIKYLLAEMGHLFTRKKIGQGGPNRTTAYRFKPVVIRDPGPFIREGHENKDSNSFQHTLSLIQSVIEAFKTRKREKGARNCATFAASCALNVLTGGKITQSEAVEQLRPGFDLSHTGDNDYNYRQFCATVLSGLRADRDFRFSFNNLHKWGLI